MVMSLKLVSIEEASKKNNMSIAQMHDCIRNGQVQAYKRDDRIYMVDHGVDKITRGAEILELII